MNKHLLLILLGFGSFGVSADCVGKKGKDFHDCLKQQLTQPNKKDSSSQKSKDLANSNLNSTRTANGNCRYEKKYYPKIDRYMDIMVGDAQCVMKGIMSDDQMIAGYWIEDKSNTMFVAVNNIRAGRDIDMDFYGFNRNYENSLADKIDNIETVKFIKRFSYNASPKPEVQMNLDKEGWKR